jgi:hypothetical protein
MGVKFSSMLDFVMTASMQPGCCYQPRPRTGACQTNFKLADQNCASFRGEVQSIPPGQTDGGFQGLEGAQVLVHGGIGRALEESGEAPDRVHILVLGPGRQAGHHHVVQHRLAQ